MTTNYKNYQQARDAAWQLLIDCGISSLPVSVSGICRRLGHPLYSYSNAAKAIERLGLSEQCKRSDGFTLCQEDKCYILYNDAQPTGRQRFTVAHELGHIILGHVHDGQYTIVNREPSPGDAPDETQANQFAARILAPACVLHALGITTAEEISRICGISLQAAEFRAARLAVLEGKGKYLSHPLERRVFAQFKDYLSAQRHQRPG